MLPKPATVTEKYLKAIHDELRKMNEPKKVNVTGNAEDMYNAVKEEPVEVKGLERHACDICGKNFKTAASLKAHKTRVHK